MTIQSKLNVFRYALVPVFIGVALFLSELLKTVAPAAETYLFLAAVVASAWIGRTGPGLFAAVLVPFVFDYFFLPPLHTLGISEEAQPYVLPFLLAALAAAWMSATRAAAGEAKAARLQDAENFKRILTNLPDVTWTIDEKGKMVYISPKVERMLGYTSEEICAGGGELLLSRTHPDDINRVQAASEDLFSGRSPFDVEFRFQCKDGTWIWVHNRAVGTHQKDGVLVADGVIEDITRRKQTEVELISKTAFLEAQANSTIDGMLVVDEHGRRIMINRRLSEIFRIPPELLDDPNDEPMLRHVTQFVQHPDVFRSRIQYLYCHPEETSQEEIELKDGAILDRYSAPVVDKSGNYYGRIWSFRDITERKRNEDTLQQLSMAVEQSPASVVITDLTGNITYVNPKFTEVTGYNREEVIGKNPRILNAGRSPREMYDELWQNIWNGKEWRGEFQNKKKNGEIFWEAAAITPILGKNGEATHFLAVKEDVTERRAMESELRQAQKLEGIGQLAAGIAHEINTPTQFVTDNLTFLKESYEAALPLLDTYRKIIHGQLGKEPPATAAEIARLEAGCDLEFIAEEVPRAIAQSLDGARRVAHIVRAMKEFSHPDSADKTETDINRSILSTITIARNEWKYVAEMETYFDESLPPILCYPGDMNQVILNLVVNAAHSIKDKVNGRDKGKITVLTRTCGAFAEIAISDTGMGIPESIQTRIYEPFFTTKEVGKGTGQGLSFAHSVVVKKHGGKIWFDTEIGCGTTFFVQLPIHDETSLKEK